MNEINFQGNYISRVNIKKLNRKGHYTTVRANFIELTRDDAAKIKEAALTWNEANSYIIASTADYIDTSYVLELRKKVFARKAQGIKKDKIPAYLSSQIPGKHIYVVTTQKKRLFDIDASKILGMIEFSSYKNSNELDYIQVRPDCISEKYGNQYLLFARNLFAKLLGLESNRPKRPFADIGNAMITKLQEMYNDKKMTLLPLDDAKSFYRRYGFSLDTRSCREYVWYPKKKRN